MTSQLEYWATIGKAAEENPDLPFGIIKETLLAVAEMKESPKEEYTFGSHGNSYRDLKKYKRA